MVTYQELERWAQSTTTAQSPAEIHGLLTGWQCAGAAWDSPGRREALAQWLDQPLSDEEFRIVDKVYNEVAEGLLDEEFGFALLLPEEDRAIDARTREVSAWCSGFLYGFGMTGKFAVEDLSADVSEVLTDIGKIASVAEEVPDDEENEADLIEITEYVRMSAMLIHAECTQKAVH